MRGLFGLFVLGILFLPLGLFGLAVTCIESSARVEREAVMTAASVEQAKSLLGKHDPRTTQAGEIKTIVMNDLELNLVLNHVINLLASGGAIVEIQDSSLAVFVTLNLSKFLSGYYLNIDAMIDFGADGPSIGRLNIGQVSFPPRVIDAVAAFGLEHLYRGSRVQNADEVIRSIDISGQRLAITYSWDAGIVDAVRDRLIPNEARESLRIYHELLVKKIERGGDQISFMDLLTAVFDMATQRSIERDPVAENRAAIVVLAAYVNGRSLTALAPETGLWVKPRRLELKIKGRQDFVQHFATSAGLAVAGGSVIANAVGLYKEIEDADGGSGFSFKDLTADKAGTRFGQLAVQSTSSARELQKALGSGIDSSALIPSVAGLEENLADDVFVSRYGGIKGRKYLQVVADIDARIAASPLY